jgi:iron-sulfur cluster repair protein YtfE (RIC family)
LNTLGPSDAETLKSLIRKKPAYIEILQKHFAYAIWNHLDDKFSDFCMANQKTEQELQQAFLEFEEEGVTEDWVTKPLYFLIDHLTVEHKEFRSYELPLILTRMEACRTISGIDIPYLDSLIKSYQDFRREFLTHMEEEEDFLFLKIMRTEASLRYPQLYPEVFKGSVSMYSSTLLHSTEAEIGEMVAGVLTKVAGFPAVIEATSELKNLIAVLKGLESKIGNHTYLESVILFPRAKKMEEDLRKRTNSGNV